MKKFYVTGILPVLLFFSMNVYSQWTKTAGPPGINVMKFYETSGILFVGTYAQGVYKSVDHGITWSPANTGIENKQVIALISDSLYLYAGTGTDGVYRSANLGLTWTIANTGIPTQRITCFLNAAGGIFAGTTGQGLYSSVDHGNTWVNANGGALGSSSIYSLVYASGVLTAGADNYMFSSPDLGMSWYPGPIVPSYGISDFLQQGDTILASSSGVVYLTTDGGVNWDPPDTVDVDIMILGLDRIGDTIYAGFSNGVYQSSNWGQTWSLIPPHGLRMGPRLFNVDFAISAENFLISCEEIGVYISQDQGSTWTQVPLSNFPAASTIDNCILVNGTTLFSGTHSDGVYASHDQGTSWNKVGTVNPFDTLSNSIVFSMLSPAPNIILAGACGYGLYRSIDSGATWTHILSGLPLQAGTGWTCINSLVQSGGKTVAATTDGIYYSADSGLTWNSTNLSAPNAYVSGLAANGTVVCAGVSLSPLGGGVFRSTNGGASWILASSIVIDPLALASDGTNYFYAGTFTDNFYSNDNGVSWFNVGPGIPFGIGGFTVLAFQSHVFIGNNTGIYYSPNHGASFTAINTGLDPYPNNAVEGLATDSVYLYAGLFLDAIWRRPLADFGILTSVNSSPENNDDEFSVFPSPATSEIQIQVPGSESFEIEICNTMGQNIIHVKNQKRIDVRRLATGMYFIVVRSAHSRRYLKFQKD